MYARPSPFSLTKLDELFNDDKTFEYILFLVPLMSGAPTVLRWIKRTSDFTLLTFAPCILSLELVTFTDDGLC
jgi:hypothetical protein